MTKMITFDFGMDSFVAVEAPEGTDPDTLHEQALEKFKERLAEGDVMLEFLGHPDLDDNEVFSSRTAPNGDVTFVWKDDDTKPADLPEGADKNGDFHWVSVFRNGETIVMQTEINKAFGDVTFATEDGLPVVIIKTIGKRKLAGQKLADITGYNVYYSQRMEGNCGFGPGENMFFLGYDYNTPKEGRRAMDDYALEYAKVYASPVEEVGNRYNENGDGKVAWPLK